jgi:hypothetical protein
MAPSIRFDDNQKNSILGILTNSVEKGGKQLPIELHSRINIYVLRKPHLILVYVINRLICINQIKCTGSGEGINISLGRFGYIPNSEPLRQKITLTSLWNSLSRSQRGFQTGVMLERDDLTLEAQFGFGFEVERRRLFDFPIFLALERI